jgi:pilus assembly protein Flp/PilA
MVSAAALLKRPRFRKHTRRQLVKVKLKVSPGQLAKALTPKPNQNIRSKNMIKRFFRDETGLELSEYAVAAALIALATVAAFQLLGTNITGKITSLANTVK